MRAASSTPTGAHGAPRVYRSQGAGPCWLADGAARDPAWTGVKAATLARAAAAGFDVLPGFVLPTSRADPATGAVRRAWHELSAGGALPLVVRSSSTAEDLEASSMAGRFESVVGVRGWDAFLDAVDVVRRSALVDPAAGAAPMAVLVQPLLDAAIGGVAFGVDPVTGRTDRLVVAVTRGAPAALVAGEVDGDRYELDPTGRIRGRVPGRGGARLSRHQARQLAGLAGRLADTFGRPQDIEWAIDRAGTLWLLQSRPITTEPAGVPAGPVLGPGPVAETFPDPLSPLEQDLWLPPLRRSLRTVFDLLGTAPGPVLDASPLVTAVGGRAVVDLDLFDPQPASRWGLGWSTLRHRGRRLRAAWQVGRLRAATPGLAEDLVARVDAQLLDVPAVDELTSRQLLALLDRVGQALEAVHGHEVLLGLLLASGSAPTTGASVALRVLAAARADGLDDDEVLARHPVVLALVPPRVGPYPPTLPAVGPPVGRARRGRPDRGERAAVLREALRLRARWLHELSGRAAWSLGARLAADGSLHDPGDVRHLGLDDLRALTVRAAEVWEPGLRRPVAAGSLPARFRLTERGRPVAVTPPGPPTAGSGAGGGRGRGVVFTGTGDPPPGAVLVVDTLDPRLAPVLGGLAGLVAETGSVLSHLAILAREAGVPTVVGVPGARDRFPAGAVVRVDGGTGEVVVEEG